MTSAAVAAPARPTLRATAPRATSTRWVLLLGALLGADAAAQTAFRFSDLDLRDPHVHVSFIGCRDVTDTALAGYAINGELQTLIQTDGSQPPDGLLDLSYLVEFLPLDQGQATNLIDSGSANCTAPMTGTSCGPLTPSGTAGDATLQAAAPCLVPIPGTTRPYAPAITSTSAPCFASPTGTLSLDLGGIPVPLRDAQIAATFIGNPASNLVNGLVRGFISEADANAIIVPPTLPLIGGQPLSSLLPGGSGNCAAHSDKDVNAGVQGWWFYLNFPAARVTLVDPFANGFADGFE